MVRNSTRSVKSALALCVSAALFGIDANAFSNEKFVQFFFSILILESTNEHIRVWPTKSVSFKSPTVYASKPTRNVMISFSFSVSLLLFPLDVKNTAVVVLRLFSTRALYRAHKSKVHSVWKLCVIKTVL